MDILDAIGIRLPCKNCGQSYEVPLRDIHLSHDIIDHQGCPVSEDTECPPVFQQFLADEKDILALREAWQRLQERASKDGGELVIMSGASENSAEEQPRKTA
jgi:hypothetical protein